MSSHVNALRPLAALAAILMLAAHAAAQPPEGGGGPPAAGGSSPGLAPGVGGPPPGGGLGFSGGPLTPAGTGPGFPGGMPAGMGFPPMGGGPFGGRLPLPVIDPKTPLKDLLPHSPDLKAVYTGEDLALVPSSRFEARPDKALTAEQWQRRKGHQVAAALHLNAREQDGYLKAMLKGRHDLKGVPFAMGDACRTSGLKSKAFKAQAALVKPLGDQVGDTFASARMGAHDMFRREKDKAEVYIQAHMAAVRQIGGAFEGKQQLAPVRYLTSAPRVEATRELARVAVFSPYAPAREEALEALAVRREADYAPVLVEALRYPWPAVASNAAAAIVKLGRKELMPDLVALLDAPDPRGPRETEADGKKVTSARELVRVNHHHNCLLCHAPAERAKASDEVFLAEMPIPGEPMSPSARGYGQTESPLLVRIDVTYLRQDFSAMQEVKSDGVWPSSQRFDFVVRDRPLTEGEAAALRKRLEGREPGVLSPYQKAAVGALREMTGRDLEAKASTWREFLKR